MTELHFINGWVSCTWTNSTSVSSSRLRLL